MCSGTDFTQDLCPLHNAEKKLLAQKVLLVNYQWTTITNPNPIHQASYHLNRPWIDLSRPPMTSNDLKWPQMTSNDLQWLPMTTNDYKWLPMTTNDYQWLPITTFWLYSDYFWLHSGHCLSQGPWKGMLIFIWRGILPMNVDSKVLLTEGEGHPCSRRRELSSWRGEWSQQVSVDTTI